MKRIFLSPPWTGASERAAVRRAFATGYVAPCGPCVDEFERHLTQLSGRRFAVATASATAAIDLAAAHWGVNNDWTVYVPTLTFIATAGPFWHRGARIVFIDCDTMLNIDCDLLEQAVDEDRKRGVDPRRMAILSVDLYGRCADNRRIADFCRRQNIRFLDDAAEAVGARDAEGSAAGAFGDAAVYSFNGNKIVTTSGGGALLTDDPALAAHARKLAQQSRENAIWYEHREVGYNYRLSNLLGALGSAQLDRLPEIKRRRAALAHAYREALAGLLSFPPAVPGENHWLTVAYCRDRNGRDALLEAMAAADIESRPVWKPLHLQPVFASCRTLGGKTAEEAFERGLCLPSGSGMSRRDFQRVVTTIRKAAACAFHNEEHQQ